MDITRTPMGGWSLAGENGKVTPVRAGEVLSFSRTDGENVTVRLGGDSLRVETPEGCNSVRASRPGRYRVFGTGFVSPPPSEAETRLSRVARVVYARAVDGITIPDGVEASLQRSGDGYAVYVKVWREGSSMTAVLLPTGGQSKVRERAERALAAAEDLLGEPVPTRPWERPVNSGLADGLRA